MSEHKTLIFHELLQKERRRNHMYQRDVTNYTGIPRTKISAYENRKQIPCRRNLDKLLECYETNEHMAKAINATYEVERLLCKRFSAK